jgi:glycine oxidase
MQSVRTWDVVIIGGGIIGLSLAIELRKRQARVLIVERGEPGQEASHAAAGMLADCGMEIAPALQTLATLSARLYPEFAHELQDESGINVDLRDDGTILFLAIKSPTDCANSHEKHLLPERLAEFEPDLAALERPAIYIEERSVDPRALTRAALKAAKHREVDIASGSTATEILISDGQTIGVSTEKTSYHAPIVVNCAGAWAGQLRPHRFPIRPVKGQMLSVIGGPKIRHVVRAPEVYLVPRSDGRLLIGATIEEAGYDKRVDADTIQRLHDAAVRLVPALARAARHELWAGLRPGTPDDLPILGESSTPGYFVAAGHFRDGILLTPITARVMAQLVMAEKPEFDLARFSPRRFPKYCLADEVES